MPKKISTISRYLEFLSAEELMEEIKKLHKLFPEVREYYQAQLQDNGEEEWKKCMPKPLDMFPSMN